MGKEVECASDRPRRPQGAVEESWAVPSSLWLRLVGRGISTMPMPLVSGSVHLCTTPLCPFCPRQAASAHGRRLIGPPRAVLDITPSYQILRASPAGMSSTAREADMR